MINDPAPPGGLKDGPVIATVAALIGDPARANMLTALMDGRALTASELAAAAGITAPTASSHLARLCAAGLLVMEKQGRHRYFRLSGPDVAAVLEGLMGLAQRAGATRTRTGPRDSALRQARVCYDHLAGEAGVALLDGLYRQQALIPGAGPDSPPRLTDHGRTLLTALGLDPLPLEKRRRPLCRTCLDWSERRHHLGGSLGAALLDHALSHGWILRGPGRSLTLTANGQTALRPLMTPEI